MLQRLHRARAQSRSALDVVRISLQRGRAGRLPSPRAGRRDAIGEGAGGATSDEDDGLVGWVVEHLTAARDTADLQVDPRPQASASGLASEGFVSLLGLPLLLESELVGVLTSSSRERHEFTPEELALGEALATSAAVAIRNARLYEETQERLRHTETLVAVSQAPARRWS